MPVPGFNAVIDLSHHNAVTDWKTVASHGIVAVIHKATEGATFRDPLHSGRRKKAKDSSLLWGSYHYASAADPALQVANFLDHAAPSDDELICLDYEPSRAGPDMSLDQMTAFVELIRAETGRFPVIYGGRLLREATTGIASSVLAQCRLWHARHAPEPDDLPPLWPTWTLWQYTDGHAGEPPHQAAGIGPCDRDTFNGTEAEFRAAWPF